MAKLSIDYCWGMLSRYRGKSWYTILSMRHSLGSKRSHAKRTKFGPRKGVIRAAREKWGQSKTVEGRGWGRGKKVMLARKPLDFEKRPLVFTVEFIY